MGSNATNRREQVNRKNERASMSEIFLLATLVATVTYAAGFSPPGGVWRDTAGHLPGDPIIRSTHYMRYLIFFYCNATACASSLMVVVLILVLVFVRHQYDLTSSMVIPLLVVMLVCLISLVMAYAAGTFQNMFTVVYTVLTVAAVFGYVAKHAIRSGQPSKVVMSAAESPERAREREQWPRPLLLHLGTFALTVTYQGGLSMPGGFWDSAEGGNRPGDAILKGARLTAFIYLNTTAFVASLLVVMVLLATKRRQTRAAFLGSILMLSCLLGSYLAGCCREIHTTVYLMSLIVGTIAYMLFQVVVTGLIRRKRWSRIKLNMQTEYPREQLGYSTWLQLIATLALSITYQAGLHPPGGVWEDNGDGHKAGDPILQTTSPRRYHAFFYCNSVSFVASMACTALVQVRLLLKHRALEQAMMVYLLGLVGAYAFGSCRDATTTVYTMGLGGAALVYVVLHVVFLEGRGNRHHRGQTSDEDDRLLDKMGNVLFLFAILVATITYQVGLTPPGGFLLKGNESGHHAGDPVLLYNYPRRYRVFFYCNSTSFMVSVAVIILLVNPNMYRPAIRTHALPLCSCVSFFCLLGAFAAGTTQHLKTSIYTLVLQAVVFLISALMLLVVLLRPAILPILAPATTVVDAEQESAKTAPVGTSGDENQPIETIAITSGEEDQTRATTAPATIADDEDRPIEPEATSSQVAGHQEECISPGERMSRADRKYLMTVGILLASVTYQAGLDPPGGSWEGSSDGHHAGYPVMQDNRRQRYMAFFYSNSISFVASILLMIQLLARSSMMWNKTWFKAMRMMLLLDFLGLLGAYTAGSSRERKTSVLVVAILLSVLAYFFIHAVLSLLPQIRGANEPEATDDDA